jgi:hypothetical protein
MKQIAKNAPMTFVQNVNVMSEYEQLAWKRLSNTPGMKQLWSNCDLFVGVGVGLVLGSSIGSVIALIVCG